MTFTMKYEIETQYLTPNTNLQVHETWKDINGFEGIYQVSNLGNVRSLDRIITQKNGVLKYKKGVKPAPSNHSGGYLQVNLSRGGSRYIHRLVAEAFIDNPNNKNEVNHKNGNKKDNTVDNLEWRSPSENQLHSKFTGLAPVAEKHPQSKLTNEQVDFIKKHYKPFDSIYGAKPLGEKYRVARSIICRIANGTKRIHG